MKKSQGELPFAVAQVPSLDIRQNGEIFITAYKNHFLSEFDGLNTKLSP